MINIIGWFKGLAFVLTNAGEFARQQQEVATLTKRIEELEAANIKAAFDIRVSKSVMEWLDNWVSDKYVAQDDIDDLVESAVNNGSAIEDACDSWMNNQDWDYNLRDSIDWDKVAEQVSEKLDWETIVSDNDIITSNDIDLDDLMLKSEHMSEDDIVTRDELSDMVVGETKRDWFSSTIREQVMSELNSIKEHPVLVRNTVEVIDSDRVRPIISSAVKDIIFSMLLQSYEMANQHQQKGDSNV